MSHCGLNNLLAEAPIVILRNSETRQSKGQFELEALEARVLLSGSDLLLASAGAAAIHSAQAHHLQPILVQETQANPSSAYQEQVSYNSGAGAGDIFEGVATQALPAAALTDEDFSPAPGTQSTGSDQSSNAGATQAQSQVQQESTTVSQSSERVSVPKATTSTSSGHGATSVMTAQLTQCLKVANGPPSGESPMAHTALVNSQVASNQSVVSYSGLASSKAGCVSSHSSSASSQNSSASKDKIDPQDGTLADLGSVIDSELSKFLSGAASGTETLTPGNVSLGGVLAFQNLSISFSNITISGGTVTGGTVTMTADSASLTLGSSVSFSSNTISGSYSIGSQQFSLSFGKTSLSVSSFLTVDADGASVTYTRTDSSITLSGGGSVSASTLTVGLSGVSIFAGINGPKSNSNAMGVDIENANLALAEFSATDGTDYYAIVSSAGTIAAVGLPSSITLSATDLSVEINGSTDGSTAVDFTKFSGGSYTVATGSSSSVNLTFSGTLLQVEGTVEVDISSYVDIKGSMAFQMGTTTTATVTNGTTSSTETMSVLTIGASDVSIFAGVNGPATESKATGIELSDASFALALFSPVSSSDTNVYYAVESSAGSLSAVGLPDSITLSATNLSVEINGSSGGSAAIDFTQFSGGKFTVATGPSSSVDMTFSGALLQVAGTVEVSISSYVDISGSMAFQMGATTTATVTNGTTSSAETMNVLTIGASDVNIFAGVNGPATESDARGIELSDAGFALALFSPVSSSDNNVYYAVKSSAGSISAKGLPDSVTLSGSDLAVEVNGSTGSQYIDFTQFSGGGLSVATGPSQSVTLDFGTSLVKVAGTLSMGIGSYINVSGSFSFQDQGGEIDIAAGTAAFDSAQAVTVTLGSSSEQYFSATTNLSMKFDSNTFTLETFSLTINSGIKLGSVVDIDTPTITLSNLTINLSTGAMSGTVDSDGTVHDPILTISAAGGSLFPNGTTLTATVSATPGGDGLGFQGSFDLMTGAFSLDVEQFHMAIGSVLTADASGVQISYDATNPDPHQQLVAIASGTVDFEQFGISGQLSNLVIYKDGFQFDSVTIAYNGNINLGSLLTIEDPSVTLTDFGMTFSNGNVSVSSTGSLTVSASSASLNIGTGTVSASATDLSVTVSLAPDTLGNFSVSASKLSFAFSSYFSIEATQVAINTDPDVNAAYFSIGTATATITAGSLSLSGSASNFSIVNSGNGPVFQAGSNFSVSFSASASDLDLPSWLGFDIQQLSIQWSNFAADPADFQLTLSASINSIHGLPAGVQVSGSISDAVIDMGKLAQGEFPITSIGSVSGSVQGDLFGLEVNAGFVMGVLQYNSDYDVVNHDGTVTDPNGNVVPGGSTTVVGSTLYVGIEGGAQIPGVGGVQIYLGFSSLGPLTFFIKAEFPLILDPDTGIAIGGFSAGVSFDTTLPAPNSPFDLRNAVYGSPADITITQWQAELEGQTALQIQSSKGGTDLSAEYSQPLVIRAGVTLYDAYASQESFEITGNIAIGVDPSNPGNCAILMTGVATMGDTVNFKAYLYIGLTVNGASTTANITFLADIPADTPIASFGGTLKFGFTDSSGNPITPPALQTVTEPDGSTTFTPPDTSSIGGFYISLDQAVAQISAAGALTVSLTGSVTLTVTTSQLKVDLSGDLNISYLGDVATAAGEIVVDYSTVTSSGSDPAIYGGLVISTASGIEKLSSLGLTINGAATFELNSTGLAQTVYLPDPSAPQDSSKSTPLAISGAEIFDVVVAGTTTGTYAQVTFEEGGATLLTMQGGFDLSINTTGLQMYAVINTLQIGPSGFDLTFNGWGLLVVNDQGVAAELSLQAGASTSPTGSSSSSTETFGGSSSPVTLKASFMLIFNTTGADVTYTIPNTLPGLPDGQGGNTLRTLTIPGGPPQADGTAGAAGPYIVITGSGELDIVGLTLNGFFRFEAAENNGAVQVSLVVSMSVNLTAAGGDVTVLGALVVNDQGVQALLEVQGGNGTGVKNQDFGNGIVFSGTFQLAINSTAGDLTSIAGVQLKDGNGNPITISAGTSQVLVNGTLDLGVNGAGFSIQGTIIITSNKDGSTTISVSGVLTAEAGGSTLLTMNADGVLTSDPKGATGVAGELTLTTSGKIPLAGSGFSFNGSFYLVVNTTMGSQPVTVGTTTTTISAGPNGSTTGAIYVEVLASGNMAFGTSSTGFLLNNGTFYLSISTNGLSVSATASLAIEVNGTQLFSATATGAMGIYSSGFAASLEVQSSFSDPGGKYFYLGGDFTLQVNTTGVQQILTVVTSTGTSSLLTVPAAPTGGSAGAYFQVSVTNATLVLGSASSSTSTALYLGGSLTLTLSSSGLAVTAAATLYLNVAGETLFSFTASGALLITSTDIAAKISLSAEAGASTSGFSFGASMTFLLEVNSNSQSGVTAINGVTVDLPAGPFFQVVATGNLKLAGVVTANGSFTLTVSTSSVVINFDASMSIFGVLFGISGDAGIYYGNGVAGIVINLNLGLGGNSGNPEATLIPGVLAVQGAFNLQYNSTGTTELGVSGDTVFQIQLKNASVIVMGFTMASGSMTISVSSSGVFSSTGSLSFDFFGFATLQVAYYFDSADNYWFYGRVSVRLGSRSFNIHGSLTVSIADMSASGISYYDNITDSWQTANISPGFSMLVDGGATAFGYTFADISAGVQINGGSVDIAVHVSVSFYFFSIGGTVHIHLGSLASVPTPPPPALATLESDGTLQLNLGEDASIRGVAALGDEDYEVQVIKVNPDGTEDVAVAAPSIYNGIAAYDSSGNPIYGIEYDNVRSIVVHNTSTSNTTIQIDNDVLVPVTITAGSGNNQFIMGGGWATITGTTGNDNVVGGPGGVSFTAGSGTSQFVGGAFAGNAAHPNGNVAVGGSNLTVIEGGYSSYTLSGWTLTYDGYMDTLTGPVVVSLTAANTGAASLTVSSSSLEAAFDGNGNANATATVELDGNLTLDGGVVTESNGATVTLTSVPTLELEGGASANTLTVDSWSGAGAVTLDGQGGSDTYRVNFSSSGSLNVQVNDTGTSGTDSLIVNGTSGTDTFAISGASVSLGSQTVTYAGVENLTVNCFSGSDVVNVTGASVPTVVNGGAGTQTFDVQAIGAPLTINTGTGTNVINVGLNGSLGGITSTLAVDGGGTDTLNLDDTDDAWPRTGTLGGTSLTGVFGTGGSLNYSSIEYFNLNLGWGGNTLTVTGTNGATSINTGGGNDLVSVESVSGSLKLTTGLGDNTVNVGPLLSQIKGALEIVGDGSDTVNVSDLSDSSAAAGAMDASDITGLGMGASGIQYSGVGTLNISLGSGGNTFEISSTNSATKTTVNSGDGADNVTLLSDSGTTFINGQDGNDVINIESTNAPTTIDTGAGVNTVNLGSLAPATGGIVDELQGAVIVVGSGSDILNVDDTGSTADKTGDLTSGSLTGLDMGAAGISYSGLASLNISLGSGNNVLVIESTSTATTTVNGNTGSDTFDVRATTGTTILNTGAGNNTVNVGSLVPAAGGVLTGINGKLVVNGHGSHDVLNVDDTGDIAGETLILTATTLSGLGMAGNDPSMGIVYQGIAALNINLGSGADTVNLRGNTAATVTTINTGAGANIINIGSTAGTSTPGTLDTVQGIINLIGSGNDTLNVDDSGSDIAETGTLNPTSLVFDDPVTINFIGIAYLNVSLSQAGDLFAVVDTFTSSSTTPVIVLNGNGGDDIFSVLDTHAVMTINGGDGDDSMYVFGNSSALYLNGDAGDDSFFIFAAVAGKQDATSVDPGAADSNGNQVYSYRVNAPVTIDGGTGNDKVYIFGTPLDDVITIDGTHVSGAGVDVTFTNCEDLVVAGLGGDDTFYIESVTVPTTIMGDGTLPIFPPGVNPPDLSGGAPPATSFNDTFYVGWQGKYVPGSLSGIQAPLTIQGDQGTDTMYVDDSGDTTGRNFVLTPTTITSDAMGASGIINYDSTLENVNILGGAGNDHFTVNGTGAGLQTTIDGGAGDDVFVVNGALTTPLALNGDSNTYVGDTLTVNGLAGGTNFVVTGFTITGLGATLSYGTMELLTVNAVGGNNSFTVNGDSIPTFLNGADGDDLFTVNSSSTPLTLNGGAGDNTFVINGNSGPLTVTADTGSDSFTVNGNSGSLSLSGGIGNDSFVINGNAGSSFVADGGEGDNTFVVNSNSSPISLVGGGGSNSFTVNAPISAAVSIDGGAGSGVDAGPDTLTVNGTIAADTFTITSSTIDGIGSTITYSALNTVVINGLAGDNSFYIHSTSCQTTINTGSGVNTVEVGSNAPDNGGVLDGILGPILVNGNGRDSLLIDDSGSTGGRDATLTASSLSFSSALGTISWKGVATLDLNLGGADDTLSIQGTAAETDTTISMGVGANTVNVGSVAPALGGVLAGVQGPLTLLGGGQDTLNVDDSGDAMASTGVLSPTVLSGFGMGASGISYSGFLALNIRLGTSANTFTILDTASIVTSVYAGALSNTFNVRAITGETLLYGGAGTDVFNVGSLSPQGGGVLSGIAGALNIVGGGKATLNIDNSGDTGSESGVLSATTLNGLGMGSAGIQYSGLASLNIQLGTGNDNFSVVGVTPTTVTTIDGGAGVNTAVLTFEGDFTSENLTLTNFDTATLSVSGTFSGYFSDNGAISSVSIGGTVTSTGVLDAGSISSMTVGGDFGGLLQVSGLLASLSVQGGTPGRIVAGDVDTISALAAYGNNVLQVVEDGVERDIQATPVAGGTMPDSVLFAYLYDSVSGSQPQVTIRITNGQPDTSAGDVRFNLALVVQSATAKFDLARLDANGSSGLGSIAVEGDILTTVSQPALGFFGMAAGSQSGVVLPGDNIIGVAVRDNLPVGSIDVAGLEGIAFATLSSRSGKPIGSGSTIGLANTLQSIWSLLGSKAVLLPATDEFRVPFSDQHSVKLYECVDGRFDLNLVGTFTDQSPENATDTAYIRVSTTGNKLSTLTALYINLVGDGGSVSTIASVEELTSTGPLGDVTVGGINGLGSVTAPSVFGSIRVSRGGISGIIQTTGVRIDPITGIDTEVSADLGSILYNKKGQPVGVTTVSCAGNFTGEIISRGDLISTIQVRGTFSGVIASQGDIGVAIRDSTGEPVTSRSGLWTRFGGITIRGGDSGQILVLGNIFGNVTIHGVLSGRIAAAGQQVSGWGASRIGILGNLRLGSMGANGAVVSGGLIGDGADKTVFSGGRVLGLVAAGGEVNLTRSTRVAAGNLFENSNAAGNMDGPVISSIFINSAGQPSFDLTPDDLQGLAGMLTNLADLQGVDGSLAD